MHGRVFYLHEMRYGFEEERFCVRIDPFVEALGGAGRSRGFASPLAAREEVTLVVHLERGRVRGFAVGKGPRVLAESENLSREAAFERVLEVAIHKDPDRLQRVRAS